MIIRSQNKNCIVNFENIEKIFAYSNIKNRIFEESHETDIRYYGTDSESMGILGIYSTEEKAIKVLDMIEDACRNVAFTDGIVFHMPQDSEV